MPVLKPGRRLMAPAYERETAPVLNFHRLQTPPGDGDVLIEPPFAQWPGLISGNIRRRKGWSFTLAGEPVASAVGQTRAALVQGDDRVVVASGHQPAFVHPGVWAKHVVLNRAAGSLAAACVDFVVDNDSPRSTALTVPVVGPEGLVGLEAIPFQVSASPAGSAYEGRPALTGEQIQAIRRALRRALGDRYEASLLPTYLDHLGARPPTLKNDRPEAGPTRVWEWTGSADGRVQDAVAQHLAGREAVDRLLEAALPEVRVSDAFGGPFLAELLLNPEPFAAAYNQALSRYRREQAVRGPDRPLPDLRRYEDRMETALWVYQPLGPRRRLWVRRAGERIDLFADSRPVGDVSAQALARAPDETLAALRPWVIRPRALTLTLWARLLVCDLFVHGIGGAKYDRITDEIIRRYFGCEPPAYACVTATLRLPLPKFGTTPETVRAARRRLRDWRYNPQRYLHQPPSDLIEERWELIARADRLREALGPGPLRREVYQAIREVNARLAESEPGRGADLAAEARRIERELESDTVASSREFFYCLQPPDRLRRLTTRLHEEG
jgi:hypothetical protein